MPCLSFAETPALVGPDALASEIECGPIHTTEGLLKQELPLRRGRRIIYLNFDEIELTGSATTDDSRSGHSAILFYGHGSQSVVVPRFEASSLGNAQNKKRDEIIDYTLAELRDIYAPYDVEFTTTRPESGNYHMVVFGESCRDIAAAECTGVALLDCDDSMQNNIIWVFPSTLRLEDMKTTVAHEIAHSLGLSHTDDNEDIMFPSVQFNVIPGSFGSGPIHQPPARCGSDPDFQDSHQLILDTVGPSGQTPLELCDEGQCPDGFVCEEDLCLLADDSQGGSSLESGPDLEGGCQQGGPLPLQTYIWSLVLLVFLRTNRRRSNSL